MKHVICPICKCVCVRNGKSKNGSQRWLCKKCNITFVPKIDSSAKQLDIFLDWLFSKDIQKDMPGEGRTFRRKTGKFWDIWTMPPIVEEHKDVLFLDGIYLGKKACILICCDQKNVLGWYLCKSEHAGSYMNLMSRIAEPKVVISDGGHGFAKALKTVWPDTKHQRCVFHVYCQVQRYTTRHPNTAAGLELYALAKDLLKIKSNIEKEKWIDKFVHWNSKYSTFLSQMTYDETGNFRPTHERLIKAQKSLVRLIKNGTMFTYLNEDLKAEIGKVPFTNNQIEGGVNSRLRAMLREHRGLSIERRIKAVFWWCYMHSEKPLSASEILKTMPTDKSINEIYNRMSRKSKVGNHIPGWGDAVVWNELHRSADYPVTWD